MFHLSYEEWRLRCELWPGVETDYTKRVDTDASSAGASFTKVCGAGGGGVMLIHCKPEKKNFYSEVYVRART